MPKKSHKSDAVPKLAAWLTGARERAKLTQEEAAKATGIRLGVIANAELGRNLRTGAFLVLVRRYRAEASLARFIAEWREESVAGEVPGLGMHDATAEASSAGRDDRGRTTGT